jgi:hypothetical protein
MDHSSAEERDPSVAVVDMTYLKVSMSSDGTYRAVSRSVHSAPVSTARGTAKVPSYQPSTADHSTSVSATRAVPVQRCNTSPVRPSATTSSPARRDAGLQPISRKVSVAVEAKVNVGVGSLGFKISWETKHARPEADRQASR